MKYKLKRIINSSVGFLYVIVRFFFKKKSYLKTTGWFESFKRGYPCRIDGEEIPWMNYTIIKILEDRLNKDLSLFEYGLGYSTIFYSRRVKNVISIEYNKVWFDLMKDRLDENVSLLFKENDIDGEYANSIEKLSDKGIIILDDSQRTRYVEALDYAKSKGFRILDIEGLKPSSFSSNRSTIIYRDNNCLDI